MSALSEVNRPVRIRLSVCERSLQRISDNVGYKVALKFKCLQNEASSTLLLLTDGTLLGGDFFALILTICSLVQIDLGKLNCSFPCFSRTAI